MRQFLYVLLVSTIVVPSCTPIKELYINEDVQKPKPVKVAYSQALGMEAINEIRYGTESYYDVEMEKALMKYGMTGQPVNVDFEPNDSLRIANICRERHVDGLILTYFAKTYRENENHDYHMAISPASVISLMYYNSDGRLISVTQFKPANDPYRDLKSHISRGLRLSVLGLCNHVFKD